MESREIEGATRGWAGVRAKRAFAVVVAAALSMGAVGASASVPAPNGVISGCYLKAGGRLRAIDAATRILPGRTGLEQLVSIIGAAIAEPVRTVGIPGEQHGPGGKRPGGRRPL